MAIIIHTGLPGHGKTLFTLWHVRKWAEREGREVYYNGIPDLQIPGWIELADAEKWHECPPRSIVVIDEAQRTFRPRGNGSSVPAHVAAAETHRHKGIDAVLITQHPMLIDGNIRRLADKHRHVIRAFGAQYATVHEWPQVMDQPQKAGGRKDSVKSQFPYPKEVYTWYKSAEAHTYKAKIPAKVIGGVLLLVGLVVGAWFLYGYLSGGLLGSQAEQMAAAGATSSAAPSIGGPGVRERPAKVKTTAEWVSEQRPRIDGLPHTAPVYDDITKPVRAPIPAACVTWQGKGKGCRCYSEQGTRLPTPEALCRDIVANGYYVAWDNDKGRAPEPQRNERPAPAVVSVSGG